MMQSLDLFLSGRERETLLTMMVVGGEEERERERETEGDELVGVIAELFGMQPRQG